MEMNPTLPEIGLQDHGDQAGVSHCIETVERNRKLSSLLFPLVYSFYLFRRFVDEWYTISLVSCRGDIGRLFVLHVTLQYILWSVVVFGCRTFVFALAA